MHQMKHVTVESVLKWRRLLAERAIETLFNEAMDLMTKLERLQAREVRWKKVAQRFWEKRNQAIRERDEARAELIRLELLLDSAQSVSLSSSLEKKNPR